MVCTHLSTSPSIDPTAYVAPGATLLGDVSLGPESSVWYQTVLRADIEKIQIGTGSNIQDGTVIHMASDRGTIVGDYVTVGHKALLHACTIGDETLIGMGAIVMDEAEIGAQCIVGAGSVVTRGFVAPAGSLVLGSPAKVVRPLSQGERDDLKGWALKYIQVAKEHREHWADAVESGQANS